MGHVISLVLISFLVFLSFREVFRYLAARRGEAEWPYPKVRLVRRLLISISFGAVLGLLALLGRMSPWGQLTTIGIILILILLGFWLIWRDLKETSRAVLQETRRLDAQTAQEIQEWLRNSPPSDTDE